MPTRRDRLRAELLTEIRTAARAQLAAGGAGSVSWRGIARAVGMSPASLYTYFASLDDIYTDLITESFDHLADTVGAAIAAAADRHLGDRMLAGLLAYRAWSVRNPAQFRLIFQDVIPGYEAPPEGPTLHANLRVSAHFVALLVEGWRSGALPPAPVGGFVDPGPMNARFGTDLTADEIRTSLSAWATFHGLVQLEVNHHIHTGWVDVDALYLAMAADLARTFGFPESSADIADLIAPVLAADT